MRNISVVVVLFVVSIPVLVDSFERLLFVSRPPDDLDWVNQRYAENAFWTWVHLFPGIVFFLSGPLQFSVHLRRRPKTHKWLGRVFLTSALFSGLGVLVMVVQFPALGGPLTQLTTFTVVGAMLACGGVAWKAIRNRNVARHKAFMVRCFALGLSVSIARVFITTAELVLSMPFEESFVLASGLAVAVNVAFAELLLRMRWI